jgi:uncharacterized protein with PQ loop repeat
MPKSRSKRVAKSSQKRDFFDYAIYFFTVATPLFEIPQAYTIFATHNASGVSIWTWGFFLIDNLFWIFYGWRRRIMPLIVTSILYLVIELIIVIGIMKYA